MLGYWCSSVQTLCNIVEWLLLASSGGGGSRRGGGDRGRRRFGRRPGASRGPAGGSGRRGLGRCSSSSRRAVVGRRILPQRKTPVTVVRTQLCKLMWFSSFLTHEFTINHYLSVVGTVKGEVKSRIKCSQFLLFHMLLWKDLNNCALTSLLTLSSLLTLHYYILIIMKHGLP